MYNTDIIRQKRGGGRWGPYDKEFCLRHKPDSTYWNLWEIKNSKTGQIWKNAQDYEASIKPKPKPKATPTKATTKPKTTTK